jgi:hypothetical protein
MQPESSSAASLSALSAIVLIDFVAADRGCGETAS